MKYFDFYKESSGRWYIDLPDSPFVKSDLEMVEGADTLLELLAQGEARVTVVFSITPFPESNQLTMYREGDFEGGGYYHLRSITGLDYTLSVWLCDVTKYVFETEAFEKGEHFRSGMPKVIYFK
jgi:hypothetical protein